ncbi:MAG: nitrous oxide reductase family maturation protein NosD [Deltaproteobacteria bacterium]|nr:nitrous oxide reductase family maturation protein NosD [Deltaproteobacteria bacterium]
MAVQRVKRLMAVFRPVRGQIRPLAPWRRPGTSPALLRLLLLFQLLLLSAPVMAPAQEQSPPQQPGKQPGQQSGPPMLLQPLVDKTADGGTLLLEPGHYLGPVVINRPITIDGNKRQAVVDNRGTGTVFLVEADGVTLRNLTIINSGESHDQIDSGIRLRSANNRVEGNRIRNTLFGVDLREAHHNLIEDNDISSLDLDLGVRGDGIKVWASHNNTFRNNRIFDSRDFVMWYSNKNLIENNQGWNNRYSLHFMYADSNRVLGNTYRHNAVGIFLMYSKDGLIQNNNIFNSLGSTGMGIGMKESSGMTILDNRLIYCATAIYLDMSPFDDELINRIENNDISYNVQGIVFHSDWSGNEIRNNSIYSNIHNVSVRGNGTALENLFEGNYWSDYQGFDRDRDGIGDTPHQERIYMDQLWMDFPAVKFFYGSPVFTFLDFLARLVPFTEPRLIMEDHRPVFNQEGLKR